MNLIQRFFGKQEPAIDKAQLMEILLAIFSDEPEPVAVEERAIMFDQVAMQVEQWTYAAPDRPWFMTFYLESGQLYGLFNSRGQLFRAGLDVEADGQTLVIGEMEPVIHEFTPVNRSGFTIMRQADGQLRFFMIAGTAIINRCGEIDSTKLYDDMIQRAEETGFYPTLDFYHLGEVDPLFEFGQFDFLGREGVVYVGSGILEADHPLTIATERALKRGDTQWGASIEYYRPEHRGIEYVDLGNGLEVAAYTEGLNTRISLLPENAAAAWFTSITMERAMDEKKLKALRTLFDNEKAYQEFLGKLNNVNTEVRDKGLISREAGEQPVAGEEPNAETPEVTPAATETLVELDDAALDEIVKRAGTAFTEQFAALTATLTKLAEGQQALLANQNGMQERLGALEVDEETKQRTWMQDLPARAQAQTRVTYRPRTERADDAAELSAADQATTVLNSLPKVGFNQ